MAAFNDAVVVTGAGVLSCNGIGREAFWEALREGRSGIGRLDLFDTSELPCRLAGQLRSFDPADFMTRAEVKRWHRHVHLALASTKLAMEDSELLSSGLPPERIAVGMGTSVGSLDENYERYLEIYRKKGWKKVNKLASPASSGHASTAAVTARYEFRGPATTLASGCSTGLDVLNWGREQIRNGLADAAVVGATEAPLSEPAYVTACALGILSQWDGAPEKAMRPFDVSSDGLVLSEGAVVMVLERASKAKARGAQILGELAGYGAVSEGRNPFILDKEGEAVSRAIGQALTNAGARPEDVDAALCHGVGLPMYDRCETAGYKKALGDHAYRIPIAATKSMIGQAYSAGGLMSALAALMSLSTGIVPPTLNLEKPHPACDLDYVPRTARLNDVQGALVTALSFGGTHSAVLLRNLN